MRLSSLVIVLCSAAAIAQVKPPVAAYPLDVLVRGVSDAQVKELQAESRRLLGLEATLPDGLALDAALAMMERKDCDLDDGCLKQFALNAKSLYALHASLESDAKQKQIIAKGRVVREDGVQVVPIKSVTVVRKGKEPIEVALREALKQLYAELKVSTLAPTRELPKKDPDPVVVVKKDPDPIILPPPPPPPVDTGAGQRAAGTGMLVAGGGVALIGVIVSAVGCSIGCAVVPVGGTVMPGSELQAVTTGRSLMTAGFVAVGVGAGVAAIGGVVLALAPAPVKSVSIVPTEGGAVVQFGGRF